MVYTDISFFDQTGFCTLLTLLTLFSCFTIIVSKGDKMKNVTITLEEDVAQWARIWAAKNSSSVSRVVGEMLKKRCLMNLDTKQQ
jgi:hypothetical protein